MTDQSNPDWPFDGEPDLDLGHDHYLRFAGWSPDRVLNPQYADVPDLGDGEHHSAIVNHRTAGGTGWCGGGITFDTATTRALRDGHGDNHPMWAVHSWEPLDISPSLLCKCGDHGFIRNGKWVQA